MGLTVIHRGAPEAVDGVVDRLLDAGLEAVAIDEPSFIVLLVTFGTYKVRVGVPEEQAEAAREVLREWDAESKPVVADLTRQLRGQLGIAAVPAVLLSAAALIYVRGWDLIPWLGCAAPALFVLSFFAASLYTRSRTERRRRASMRE